MSPYLVSLAAKLYSVLHLLHSTHAVVLNKLQKNERLANVGSFENLILNKFSPIGIFGLVHISDASICNKHEHKQLMHG